MRKRREVRLQTPIIALCIGRSVRPVFVGTKLHPLRLLPVSGRKIAFVGISVHVVKHHVRFLAHRHIWRRAACIGSLAGELNSLPSSIHMFLKLPVLRY
jgi:hypothetical protein